MDTKQGVRERLGPLMDQVVQAEKKARRRGKPEDWHKLRTSSRKLRGALLVYAPVFGSDLQAWIGRRAKRITKLPTEVRDLDVAVENLEALHAATHDEGERRAAKEMRRALERERERRSRQAQHKLEREKPASTLSAVLRKALRRGVDIGPAVAASKDSLEACAETVRERRAQVRGWAEDEPLHRLRVAVKKYRGALAADVELHGRGGGELRATLETLKQIQDVLGEHHDWSGLGRRLAEREAALADRPGKPSLRRREKLAGYRGLQARIQHEQRARFDRYHRELHERLPLLLASPERRPSHRAPTSNRQPVAPPN